MDKTKVGQLLYAEFGENKFRASQISEGAMVALVKEMGISETVGPELNTLVSKMLESMYGKAFRLESGAPAYFEIDWSERTHKADSFQVIPIDIAGSKETDWVSDELVGVGFPEAEMTYDVVLTYSEGSYSVECPALKGCYSQADSEEEALENIKEVITGCLQREILDARQRTQAVLDLENEAGFPAKIVNVKIGGITA